MAALKSPFINRSPFPSPPQPKRREFGTLDIGQQVIDPRAEDHGLIHTLSPNHSPALQSLPFPTVALGCTALHSVPLLCSPFRCIALQTSPLRTPAYQCPAMQTTPVRCAALLTGAVLTLAKPLLLLFLCDLESGDSEAAKRRP